MSQIVNKFNEFFIGIGRETTQHVINSDKTYSSYLNQNFSVEFTFKNASECEVKKNIMSLQSKNSSGFDDISSKLFKTISDPIIKPLCIIFNQSIKSGIFPNKLKIAKIYPIFKIGTPTLFNNYRPISIIPVIPNIFEKNCIQPSK